MAIQLRPDELIDIIRSEFMHATVTQELPDNLIMGDDAWIGLGPAGGRIEFDSTPAPDEINFLACAVGFGTPTPATNVAIYENNADTAPAFLIEQDGTGDAALEFLLTGGQAWSAGIDNSDGDKFKIARGATVSTNTVVTATTSGDVGIGATAGPTVQGGMVLFFGDNSNDPTMAANTAGLYGKDVAGTVEMFAVDEAGNTAQLTPHDPDTGEWIFYTKNVRTGRVLRVDMERLVKQLDSSLGGGYIHEYTEA